jgi:hypothetical protein
MNSLSVLRLGCGASKNLYDVHYTFPIVDRRRRVRRSQRRSSRLLKNWVHNRRGF